MKKTFLILMLGTPFPWIDQWVPSVQHLAKDGWDFKVFTPAPLTSQGNVEFCPMTAEEFNKLAFQKIGVNPGVWITDKGIPSKHVTDYIVAHGAIFESYIKGSDYWGHIGLDNVVGNLSKFLPDEELSKWDFWSDDIQTVNGNFLLVKNTPWITRTFMDIPKWQYLLSAGDCPGCVGEGTHELAGTDEYLMTQVVKDSPKFGYPKRFFIHSHDRLFQHYPQVHVSQDPDGTLWEHFKDAGPPSWVHFHDAFAKEIAYYHFQRTKKWPL